VRRLNEVYRDVAALHRIDRDPSGFRWVVNDDREQSVLAFLRTDGADADLVVMNNTPSPRHDYRMGLPGGSWELLANSDDAGYGGSGMAAPQRLVAAGAPMHGFDASVSVDLPPLAVLVYRAT
jgi:1,4-alpha-glucan branching enzyme